MRALVYADWCVVRSEWKRYLIPAAVFMVAVTGASLSDARSATDLASTIYGATVSGAVLILSVLELYGFFGYDEREDWEAVRLSLPISRRMVVRARYCTLMAWFVTALIAMSLVAVLVGAIAALAIYGEPGAVSATDAVMACGVTVVVFSTYLAVAAPICFRVGVTKARPYLTVPFFACMLLMLGPVVDAVRSALGVLAPLIQLLAGAPLLSLVAAIALAAVTLWVSMLVSERLYARRSL